MENFNLTHMCFVYTTTLRPTNTTSVSQSKPGPIMLFKLPIMLLSSAPNFPYYTPIILHRALSCFIMLHTFIKFLLPKSENIVIFLSFKLPASLDNYLTVLLEYTDLFQQTFENLVAGFVFKC